MGRISRTAPALMHWAVILTLAALAALSEEARGQDSLIGYEGLELELFTPAEVVDAGGAPTLSDSTPKATGTAAPGISGEASRDDHVHADADTPNHPLSTKVPLVESGTGAAGTGTAVSREDHVHPARSLPPIPPYSTNTPQVESGNGNAGMANTVSRGDHVHPAGGGGGGTTTPLSDKTPLVDSGTGDAGTGGAASREDHAHPPFPLSTFGTVGSAGTCAKANSARDGLTYGDCGSPRVLSNRNPAVAGTADPGNRTDVSRSDHVHPERTIRRELPSPTSGTRGDIPRVNTAGNAYEVVDAHVAVLSGLPAITGQANKALTVNAAATGVEWKAVSGGSPDTGGGGASWDDYKTGNFGTTSNCPTRHTVTLSTTERDAIIAGHNMTDILGIAVRARTNTGHVFGAFWPKGPANIAVGAQFVADFVAYSVRDSFNDVYDQNVDIVLELGASPKLTLNDQDCFDAQQIPGYAISGLKIAGGGGGGSSGPSIPTPTAAGASRYLRVNAAGAAYEVGTNLDDAVAALDSEAGDLEDLTRDLYRAPNSATPTWALNSNATNAQIAYFVGTGSAPNITGLTFQTSTVPKPAPPGWATGFNIVRLASGQNRGNYRVRWVEPDTVTVIPGNQWSQIFPSAGAAAGSTYWLPFAGVFRGRVTSIVLDASSNANHIGQTDYHGDPVAVRQWAKDDATKIPASKLPADELPAIPGDTATKQYALETMSDGSGVEWSNDIFSALNTNAQDIGDALERVGHVDMPSDAEASKSALAAGQVWTIASCDDTVGSRACTAGFAASAHGTERQLVKFGTGAANATSASFAPSRRLSQHALISGTSYDEFIVIARHVAGNPTRTMIRSCRIPGIQGDWVANAATPVHLISESENCSLVAPVTGNLTVTWAAPLAGEKIAGDTWRLYGVDWR
ncbi:MAG: hypothetical protein OXJ90_08855 [Spirochaetaceae bacterium]|nr:hypothetical protein [Spirochaetaceae bacterium]